MCSGGAGAGGAVGLVARLHATLDALLALDPVEVVDVDLPGLVVELVRAGHRLHAAQLDVVGRFDAAGLTLGSGHRSTARWLEQETRVSASQAGGLVGSARAVRDHLPATRDAAAAGEVSAGHVSAVCQVVRTLGVEHAQAAEPILLDLARRSDPSVVRRATAYLHATLDPQGAQAALDRVYAQRGVTLSVAGTRAYLDGVLDVESAEVLHTALMPLMTPTPGDTRTGPQRRADALVDLARRALDAGALPTLGGQRPQLSVVVQGRDLAEGRGAGTLPWTGAAVPVPTVLRWACDAHLTGVWARLLTTGGPGGAGRDGWRPLAVGRTARTVTPTQTRALAVRDGGCVHPGCQRSAAFCDAHHVQHWAHGGPTDLPNLVLLCRHHHRTLHAGHWHLSADDPDDPDDLDERDLDERDVGGGGSPSGWVARLPGGHTAPLQTATDRSPPLGRTG